MKTCFKCKVEKELSEFHRHSKMSDGHINKCKDCACADSRKHRNDNIEHYINYDRLREQLEDRRLKKNIYVRNYWKKYPERKQAMTILNHGVRDGEIQKQPCAVCGTLENLQAHHHDYSKPLDVIWYCGLHHRQVHGKKR